MDREYLLRLRLCLKYALPNTSACLPSTSNTQRKIKGTLFDNMRNGGEWSSRVATKTLARADCDLRDGRLSNNRSRRGRIVGSPSPESQFTTSGAGGGFTTPTRGRITYASAARR